MDARWSSMQFVFQSKILAHLSTALIVKTLQKSNLRNKRKCWVVARGSIMSLECWSCIHIITWHCTNLQPQNLFSIFLIGRFYPLSTYTINQKLFIHSGTEKKILSLCSFLVHPKWVRNKNIFSYSQPLKYQYLFYYFIVLWLNRWFFNWTTRPSWESYFSKCHTPLHSYK